jgi:hypothetical protein
MAKAKRKPTKKAKAAYGKLLVKAYKRFQPGGKGYLAVKKHHPEVLRA